MKALRRGRVVSVLVAVAIFSFGGLRQAAVPASASAHVTKAETRIGTACVMERTPAGNVQTCR